MLQDRKVAAVFGGSGFIGRYVVKRLAGQGYVVRVAVRDTQAARILRPLGTAGQVVPLYVPVTEPAAVARAVEGAEVAVNLVGILAERRHGDFMRIHAEGAGCVARMAAAAGVQRLVHVSALGADEKSPSLYARSKAAGEAAVRAAFEKAVILRPSILFGVEDQFFNRFAGMAAFSPVVPIVGGASKMQPVYVGDVAEAIAAALGGQAAGQLFELGGPEVKSFRQLIELMLKIIERRRLILDLPPGLAAVEAMVLERLPGKLLTRDQIKMLQCDNIVSDAALDLLSLGVTPTRMDLILPRYLARYRPGGRRRESAYRE